VRGVTEGTDGVERHIERENDLITALLDEKMAAKMLKLAESSPEVRQILIDAGKERIWAPILGGKTPKKPPAHLYFMQAGHGGPIKIGAASDVAQRMATMQTGSPEQLYLVGYIEGGGPQERELHKRFAHLRLHGEWFKPAQELIEHISSLSAADG
jgi:Meiotically Up-regulated Gene 113 (MUG113) protein